MLHRLNFGGIKSPENRERSGLHNKKGCFAQISGLILACFTGVLSQMRDATEFQDRVQQALAAIPGRDRGQRRFGAAKAHPEQSPVRTSQCAPSAQDLKLLSFPRKTGQKRAKTVLYRQQIVYRAVMT